MEDTLVEMVEKADVLLVEMAKKEDVILKQTGVYKEIDSVFKKRLIEYKKSCCITHFKEDSLAYAVAGENDSYLKLPKLIEEKFNTSRKKIGFIKSDKTFDDEVRMIINSMNHVGVEYFNPEDFTTEGRRRNNNSHLLISGGAGLFTAALPKLIELGSTADYNAPKSLFVPIIAVVAAYIGCKLKRYLYSNSESLQESAQKTDEFLRQHYIKLPPS